MDIPVDHFARNMADMPLPKAGLSRGKMLGLLGAAVAVPALSAAGVKLWRKYHQPGSLPQESPGAQAEEKVGSGPITSGEVAQKLGRLSDTAAMVEGAIGEPVHNIPFQALGYYLGQRGGPHTEQEAKEEQARPGSHAAALFLPGYAGYHLGRRHQLSQYLGAQEAAKRKAGPTSAPDPQSDMGEVQKSAAVNVLRLYGLEAL